jgi:S-adenosylmethionine decarboxylase
MTEFDFAGTHVLCDISEIDPLRIIDNSLILEAIRLGIEEAGAHVCGMQRKDFEPNGITAVYVLSESHVSVHTYPDRRSLFIDAFTCGSTCRPERIVDSLLRALGPCEHRLSVLYRGAPIRTRIDVGAAA